MNSCTGYLGTYAAGAHHSVCRFQLDCGSGALSLPVPVLDAPDSKYLSLRGALLACPLKKDGRAGILAARIDASGRVVPLASYYGEQDAACYILQDEDYIYTANYHEGSILIYRRKAVSDHAAEDAGRMPEDTLQMSESPTGASPAANPSVGSLPVLEPAFRLETGDASGCHQVLCCGPFLYANCLLRDRMFIYDSRKQFALTAEIPFPAGTGPRHGVMDHAQKRLFLTSELSNELFVLGLADPGRPEILGRVPVSPVAAAAGQAPAGAAIRLSQDEHFLYVSTRFSNTLSVFGVDGLRLTKLQEVSCGGDHPRDMILSPDGRWLLAANRYSDCLVSFPVDRATGLIGKPVSEAAVPQPVSIVFQASQQTAAEYMTAEEEKV